MTKRKTDVTRAIALATLLGGAGCAESGGTVKPTPSSGDPVEAAIEDLGVPIPGCDASGSQTNGSGFASGTLTLSVDTDPLVLSAVGGIFTANGYKCTQHPSTGADKVLKNTGDVTSIVINGTANDNKVILDFLPGTFGTRVIGPMGGGIKVDFAANSGAGIDSLMLRGSSTAETYRFAATVPAMMGNPVTDVYVEMSGDKIADIDLKLSQVSGAKLSIVASMGGGNDIVNADPGTTEVDHFGSATISTGALPKTIGVTAYGGAGDDQFTGGLGDDSFFGGDGNDKFFAFGTTATDGADVYSGDNGDDTVSYATRTQPMKIDIGPVKPAIEGNADLRNPKLYGASGLLALTGLTAVIDGKVCTTTFGTMSGGMVMNAPATPSDVVTAINTQTSTCIGGTAAKYSSLNGKNHLVVNSNTNDMVTSFVKAESDPGIGVATTGAETVLGLTAGGSAATTVTGTAVLDGTSSPMLDTQRLVLTVNNVYVPIVFNMPADGAAVVSQINAAIDTALGSIIGGTTPGTWAKLNSANNLVLSGASYAVKDGTMAVTLTAANFTAGPLLGFASSMEGTVDLTTSGLLAMVNGKTIGLVIDGARIDTAFASAPANPAAIATAINMLANMELGTTNVTYARVNTANHLVIASGNDLAGVSGVSVVGDPMVATATTGAEAILGLTVGPGGTRVIGGDVSPAGLYGVSGTISTTRLLLIVNGTYASVVFASPMDQAAMLTAINGVINPLGGSASVNAITHKLEIAGTWIRVVAGNTAPTYTAADAIVGLVSNYNSGMHRDVADADDGLVDEHDDVRYSTENITSGSGNDVLSGNDQKNTIKGGDGNDIISGGGNGATCLATAGDVLQGEGGDDTFVLPIPNCRATLTGGDGNNTADFSGRGAALQLRNNGTADDGESTGAEAVNIGTDIKTMIGGFGADAITGGASDEVFVGGPGADTIVGGTGDDTVDYSASPAPVNVTLCFTAMLMSCPMADDGASMEGDQIYQIEHVIGSAYDDTLSGSTSTNVGIVIEGGAGNDIITGGMDDDTLWGDAGDDTLHGGPGADQLSGDSGSDTLDGGDGDQDICLGDMQDLPKTACEL